MKGFGALKIGVDVLMVMTAIYLLTKGFAGESVQPFILIISGLIMLAEQFTDIFHAH